MVVLGKPFLALMPFPSSCSCAWGCSSAIHLPLSLLCVMYLCMDSFPYEVLCSSQDGHILRTKVLGTDEGGVSCGAAALDSPNLIPMEEFVGMVTVPTL